MAQQKIIIDTDPGVDDAMAIFLAMLRPELNVVGLTCVFGNVTVEIATRNALVLAERVGRSIPVAMGANKPLVQSANQVSDHVHGVNGFGTMPAQTPKGKPIDETAAEFICRLVNDSPGEITLCPIGPLTNIALALQLDPSIAPKVKSVVLMGGAFGVSGNVTKFAEANIWNDPHAADIVFAADWQVTMVGLDVTGKINCSVDDFSMLASKSPILGGFINEAAQFYMDFYKTVLGYRTCLMHDAAAVIAIFRPDLFSYETHKLKVIVNGERIGETCVGDGSERRGIKICTDVQVMAVKNLFLDTLANSK